MNDNGKVIGLSDEDMNVSLKTMEGMAKRYTLFGFQLYQRFEYVYH